MYFCNELADCPFFALGEDSYDCCFYLADFGDAVALLEVGKDVRGKLQMRELHPCA
jgi:hypothetical protein